LDIGVYLLMALGASLGRMFAAYLISLAVALALGSVMARSRLAEHILLPILDILQSIPILGFFPAALALFVAYLPGAVGAELASIFLVSTSLVWNMIFGVYSSIKSLDPSFEDMARVYGFGALTRFTHIYVPASRRSLVANSLVSWAGGWFFLTSAEVISMGSAEYKLVGLGSLILDSYSSGQITIFYIGVAVLLAAILATYILIWNPFARAVLGLSIPCVRGAYSALRAVTGAVWRIFSELLLRLDVLLVKCRVCVRVAKLSAYFIITTLTALLAVKLASSLNVSSTAHFFEAAYATLSSIPLSLARVSAVVAFAAALSILLAYLSYRSRMLSSILTISGEVLASIPAVIWWPLLMWLALKQPLGTYLVSLIVFLQGSFWYLHFNVLIYGLSSVRREFEELAKVYNVKGLLLLRYMLLPSILPSIAAGALSAWGGAWNATIVAEYITLERGTIDLGGVGSLLNKLAARGEMLELVVSVLMLSAIIVLVNKTIWARLFSYIAGRCGGE